MFSASEKVGLPLKVGSYLISEAGGVPRERWNAWLASSSGGHYLQSYERGEFKRGYG